MAVVIRDNSDNVIKCYRCGSVYASHKWIDLQVEPCPVCGAYLNGSENIIPKWKLFILRFFGRL